jgi:hypothetical protein
MNRAPLALLFVVAATLGLTAFALRPARRDLTLPDTDVREVAGVTHDVLHGRYVLVATDGEQCEITVADWRRAHPGERWGCQWERP